jgi:hypothetical protein
MSPFVRILLCSLILLPPALAQRGAISGVVLDPSGARIARADLNLLSPSTNYNIKMISNNEGLFRFPDLLPGEYRVTASRAGFSASTLDLILSVEERKNVTFVLSLESASQSITVESSVSSLQMEGAHVSMVVSQQLVHNLPLNGRSFQTLFDLTPGLVLTPVGASDQGQFSVNGQRANANYLMVDGVSGNVGVRVTESGNQELNGSIISTGMAGGSQGVVSVDEVQEFRVQTSSFAPEFGRTPGAQIQVSTRSGTNTFHGSAYDYFRNDALDASDWFVNSQRLAKPPLRQNDFGGVLGGPVLPNRLFFFTSIESLHLVQPRTGILYVPTPAVRSAPGNAIAAHLLNAYPLPNQAGSNAQSRRYAASYGDRTRSDLFAFRSDYVLNERFHAFSRVSYGRGYGYQGMGTGRYRYSAGNTSVTAGATVFLAPSVTNDLRLNYSTASRDYGPTPELPSGAETLQLSNMIPSFNPEEQWANLIMGPYSNLMGGTRAGNYQRQFNVVDAFDHVIGKHQLKVGADVRLMRPWVLPGSTISVSFQNLDQINAGVAANLMQSRNQGKVTIRYDNYSLYGQDTWRVRPGLNLTYGLRWEINPAPSDSTGGPAAIVRGLGDPNATEIALKGRRPFPTEWTAIAPRLGAAWSIKANGPFPLTLRTGAGVFYDLSASGAVGSSGARSRSQTVANVPLAGYSFPFPTGTILPMTALLIADPGIRLPKTYQYNVSIEAGLGASNHLTVSYVGAVGRGLVRNHSYTGLTNPTATYMAIYKTDGTSDYNALQMQFRRSGGRWLEAVASYTFGKAIDDASNQVTVPV